MYEVQTFDVNDNLKQDFDRFADEHYKNDLFYSGTEQIPVNYQTKLFIVKDKCKTIARAVAITDKNITYKNKKAGLIGFYESIDDNAASKILIDSVSNYFKNNGIYYLIGPMNGSTWNSYRFTKSQNSVPFFLDIYNKPWYSDQFLNNNFTVIGKYYSTKAALDKTTCQRVDKFENYFYRKGIKIRQIDLNNFKEELKIIYDLSVESFKDNFLYTEISYKDFFNKYQNINKFINDKLSYIALNSDNKPVGFIFCVDNIIDIANKTLIIKSLGTLKDNNHKGLGTFLVEKTHKNAIKYDYKYVLHALMHEDNISYNILNQSTSIYQKYLLFGKAL